MLFQAFQGAAQRAQGAGGDMTRNDMRDQRATIAIPVSGATFMHFQDGNMQLHMSIDSCSISVRDNKFCLCDVVTFCN